MGLGGWWGWGERNEGEGGGLRETERVRRGVRISELGMGWMPDSMCEGCIYPISPIVLFVNDYPILYKSRSSET